MINRTKTILNVLNDTIGLIFPKKEIEYSDEYHLDRNKYYSIESLSAKYKIFNISKLIEKKKIQAHEILVLEKLAIRSILYNQKNWDKKMYVKLGSNTKEHNEGDLLFLLPVDVYNQVVNVIESKLDITFRNMNIE